MVFNLKVMKKIQFIIFLFISINIFGQKSNLEILEKSVAQLNSIETVFYTSRFEGNESKMTYIHSEDEIFFDFSNRSKNSTPKYYIKNKDAELIYDGKKYIQSLVKERLILTDGSLSPNNPLRLTLYPIRELIPQLMSNKNVEIIRGEDVIVNGNNNYLFDFKLKNSVIDWENLVIKTFAKTNVDYNTYTLIINKSDYLPRKIIMPNGPTGTGSRTIENLNFEYKIDNRTWTGELLPSDYSTLTFEDYFKKMRAKMKARSNKNTSSAEENKIGSWKIPNLENGDLVDFSEFNGKIVLLEFWFKYCGPCVKAVPQLNSLYSKYKGENFLMYGIEFIENFPRENLQEYSSKIKMKFPILYKGRELANAHEIRAAPTIMIIDKKGNVVFLESGFDQMKIEKILKKYL